MTSCPSWVSAQWEGTPLLEQEIRMDRTEGPVGGRKTGASPAEGQSAPPHPHWEGGAAEPRGQGCSAWTCPVKEGKPLWGPSLPSLGVCLCSPHRQLPRPWAGPWGRRVRGSVAVPSSVRAFLEAEAAVARFCAYLLGGRGPGGEAVWPWRSPGLSISQDASQSRLRCSTQRPFHCLLP